MTTNGTAALTPASDYIAASNHTGRWYRRIAMPNPASFTAAELAGFSPVERGQLDTGEFVVWESAGGYGGTELFVRTRMVAQPGGWLACYDADGRHIRTHPADRLIRILTK